MKASDVMTVNVVTVSPDHGIRHAAQMMLDHHISGLPVINDNGQLIGIVTEGDFLRRTEFGLAALAAEPGNVRDEARSFVKSHSWKVGDVMTVDPATIDRDTSLPRIAELMLTRRVKRLPVLTDMRLVGIVSRADLLQALITADRDDTAPGDAAIERSIRTRLREEAGLKPTNITFTVADGVVHFRGTVEKQSERDAARVVAESVRGVQGVIDDLVQTPASVK